MVSDLTLTRVVFELQFSALDKLHCEYLTITRVVFEFIYIDQTVFPFFNLTLTRVVFEYVATGQAKGTRGTFNFNKSCI